MAGQGLFVAAWWRQRDFTVPGGYLLLIGRKVNKKGSVSCLFRCLSAD